MSPAAPRILLLGDPRLRAVAAPVEDFTGAQFQEECSELMRALEAFRAEHGFGRAIAAPQLGFGRRFLALDLGDGPWVLVNPAIGWKSDETMTLWDDCMSFPHLLVRLRRHVSITVSFQDQEGTPQEWPRLDRARSELLQHEIDHLDGILALDRALDREAVVYRQVFEAGRDSFTAQVDYVIGE